MRICHFRQPGSFYGWLGYYLGAHEDPRQKGKRPDLKDKVTVPDVLMQAHTSPLQIAFDNGSNFPAVYLGSAFVILRGSRNRANRAGYNVVRLIFDNSGKPTGEVEDFMTGFVVSDKAAGRPVRVAVTQDGSLFVSEDGNGSIASDVLWHKRPVRTAPRVGETIPGALVVQGHPKRAKSIFVRRKKVNHAQQ